MRIVAKLKACALVALAVVTLAGAQGMTRVRSSYSAIPVLRNSAARAELKLTPAQGKEIDGLLPGRTPGKPMSIRAGQLEEVENKARKLLTPAQVKRLDELVIQYHSPSIALRDDVARKIGLTAKQRETMESVWADTFRKAAKIDPRGSTGAIRIGPEVVKAAHESMAKVLTPAQRTALVKLGGKPVKLRP